MSTPIPLKVSLFASYTNMEYYSTSTFPLRFSSIFWTKNEPDSVGYFANPRYQCFESDVIINTDTLRGVGVLIAGRRNDTQLQPNHAYRIDGNMASAGFNGVPVLFEDHDNTIALDHAEVRLNCLANKVTTQGFGQIVQWTCRPLPGGGSNVEVIKVMHRSPHDNAKNFYADYYIDSHITCTLSITALTVGNIINLRGNVIGHSGIDNVWQIQTSEIQQIIHCDPQLRRSR